MKDNRLIAEFMGYDISTIALNIEFMGVLDFDSQGDYSYLKYHESWDWLMPVVRKIEQRNELIGAHILSSDIDATYQAVVKFIKIYNNESRNI